MQAFLKQSLYSIVSMTPPTAPSVYIITKKGYTSCAGHLPACSQIHSHSSLVLPVSQDQHFPESLHKWFLSRFGKWEALLDYLGVGERSSQGILPSPSLLWWHLWHWLCSLHNTSSHGIIIPIYFRSHKIATERFRLPVDGSASEPW